LACRSESGFFFFRHSGESRNPEEKSLDPGSVIPAEAGTGMTEREELGFLYLIRASLDQSL